VTVAVCDYGAGNVLSVLFAFARLEADVCVADTPAAIATADLAVLPGVGSAASAMAVLRERGLDQALCARVGGDGPTLGICLGLQLALDRSDEDGGVDGLGLLPGRAVLLREGRGSYVAALLEEGAGAAACKVGEEGLETALAGAGECDARLISELADLWFHSFVLLAARGLDPAAVERELQARHETAQSSS
jgi:phosphoribosyl-ATP pyrophosphohydrolase